MGIVYSWLSKVFTAQFLLGICSTSVRGGKQAGERGSEEPPKWFVLDTVVFHFSSVWSYTFLMNFMNEVGVNVQLVASYSVRKF